MKKIKKSGDGKVKFYEKSHKYKKGARTLTSVTTFLGQFFEKFDVNKIAKLKAMISKRKGEKGKGVRHWKNEWKESAEHGSRVHAHLEQFAIKYGKIRDASFHNEEFQEERDRLKYKHGKDWFEKYFRSVGEPFVFPEVIVYNEFWGLAGQIDLLVSRNDKDNTSNKRFVDLIDYKTNKSIDKEGYKGKKAKDPISDLYDCNYTKYMLQLSLYAYMLEQRGYEIGDLILVHLKEDGYEEYKITYNKEVVKKLLEF